MTPFGDGLLDLLQKGEDFSRLRGFQNAQGTFKEEPPPFRVAEEDSYNFV